jgi:hypothetical protein
MYVIVGCVFVLDFNLTIDSFVRICIRVDDVGEEPPKSEDEADDDHEVEDVEMEALADDAEDDHTQQRGYGYDDDDEGENEYNDEEEMDGKSSEASGSPGQANHRNSEVSSNLKRPRSNTPPLLQPPKLDDRMKFASNLLLLNGTDLGHIVSLLEQHCPAVLECNNTDDPATTLLPERMEINVDVLMEEYPNIFNMIQQYSTDHIVKKRAISFSNKSNVKVKDISNRRKERKS